jgi:serine protease Do
VFTGADDAVESWGVGYQQEFDFACQWAASPGRQSPDSTASPPPSVTPAPRQRTTVVTGSGFIVSPRRVVTNYHVIDECRFIAVRHDGSSLPATLAASAEQSDLALLSVDGAIGTPAALRSSASLGEDITVAGYPLAGLLSDDIVVTGGLVNSLAGLRNDPSKLQISAPIQVGNSGGPLIDRAGAVVGVVVSKLAVDKAAKVTGDMAQNVNFAIKPEVLRLFLDTNRVQYKTAVLGLRMDGIQLAERARQFTVQVICEK